MYSHSLSITASLSVFIVCIIFNYPLTSIFTCSCPSGNTAADVDTCVSPSNEQGPYLCPRTHKKKSDWWIISSLVFSCWAVSGGGVVLVLCVF